jgi:hypothetical protein
MPSLPAPSANKINIAIDCSDDAALTDDERRAKTKERFRWE